MKTKSQVKKCLPLSIYEQNVLLPILMKGLEVKKGKVNAVTRKQILTGIKSQNVKINRRHVDKIINHIRMNDLIEGLVGSTTGYYITSTEQELMDYEVSLQKREASIKKVRMIMQRQRRSMFSQEPEIQTQLF